MQLGACNWAETKDLHEKVVLIPLGSMEQHGHHLPLLTDTMIGEEIVRRASLELEDEVLFLPMQWLGASDHHLAFSGTVSVSNSTYTEMLKGVISSLVGSGFRRIMLFNAHAGNVLPANQAIHELQLKYGLEIPDVWLAFASWFTLAAPQIAELDGFTQVKISHACEWETSQIMQIAPELVKSVRPTSRFDFGSQFYSADHSKGNRVDVPRRIEQASASGAFGWPELATPEKGDALFRVASQELVSFLREFATWQAPKIV
jgi:creatinine amidohydrolase